MWLDPLVSLYTVEFVTSKKSSSGPVVQTGTRPLSASAGEQASDHLAEVIRLPVLSPPSGHTIVQRRAFTGRQFCWLCGAVLTSPTTTSVACFMSAVQMTQG